MLTKRTMGATALLFAAAFLAAAASPARADVGLPDELGTPEPKPEPEPEPEPAPAPKLRPRPSRTERWAAEPPPEEPISGEEETLEFRYPRFRLEGNAWFTTYQGKLERERDGHGSSFHPEARPFGLDRTDAGFQFRGAAELDEGWSLEAEYARVAYDGNGVLDRDITFDGRTFPDGTPVRTKIEVQFVTVQAEWIWITRTHVRLGLPFGLGWYSQYGSLRDRSTGVRAADREDAWSPFLGLSIDIPFGRGVGIDARARFFGYAWSDGGDLAVFGMFDFETRLYLTIEDTVRFAVGFRYINVENDLEDGRNDIDSDFKIAALTLGVTIIF